MKLSVIIVNYNVRFFLEQALHSVYTAGRDLDMEVYVVDNASSDQSVPMVRERFPAVKLIVNEANPGFGVANNQALDLAAGEYVLFLNPDTLVSEETLNVCISYMDAHPDTGAAGVRMVDGSGRFLPESRRGLPTPWVAMTKALGLHRLFPRSRVFNRYYMGYMSEWQTHDTDVLCGAFMFVRREVLLRTGGFDEAFFMYGEDIDLSYRIAQTGSRIVYLPDTTIIHYKGESTRKGSLNYVRHFYQAMFIFAEKHFSSGYAQWLKLLVVPGIYGRAAVTVAGAWMKRLFWPVADLINMVFSFILVKDLWAMYYYHDPDYYPNTFYWVNLPLLCGTWLVMLFLFGVYDRPFHIRRLLQAMFLGFLASGLIYGLLDLVYRPSRAILILGFALSAGLLAGWRMLFFYLRYRKLPFGRFKTKRIAVVGSSEESDRIRQIAMETPQQSTIVGQVSPDHAEERADTLGRLEDLAEIIRVHKIDEIIFAARDVPAADIMSWMHRIGPDTNYKIAAPGSEGIVGSKSKNSSGELYTFSFQYKLSRPEFRRQKRLLDLLVGGLGLVLSPVLMLFYRHKLTYLSHALALLTGKITLVGYQQPRSGLPELKRGLLRPHLSEGGMGSNAAEASDVAYARHYSVWTDLDILWEQRNNLDKVP